MKLKTAVATAALLLPLVSGAAGKPPPKPAATQKQPVETTYHGTTVVDPYQWMESATDPKVQQWTDTQNAYTRATLDKLPGREGLRQRITELLSWKSPAYGGLEEKGGVILAMKFQPPKQQPTLVVLGSLDDTSKERVLLDPTQVDPSGKTTIDWFQLTHDGKKVAVSLSKSGTESGDVSVYDVATAKALGNDVVPRVNGGTAGGSLAWNAQGTGFFYTRYPRGEERPAIDREVYQQVYFHALGTPTEKDAYALGKDFPRIAMTDLEASDDGKYTFARVANGDGGEFELYLHGPTGKWAQVAKFTDKVVSARFGSDGAAYLLSRKDASRGKVLRLPLATPTLDKATVIVPEGEATVQSILPTKSRLYLMEQLGGPSQMRIVDLAGKPLGLVPTLPVSSVGGAVRQGADDVLFANTSFTTPAAWYRYSAADGKVTKTALARTAAIDMSDVEVVRTEATSKDGTKVPLTILKKKGTKLNGKNPAWLTGYGGFNISIAPGYNPMAGLWLEQGGVYAVANLRGGSEFGEAWHQAGSLTKKQNVFDDFYACAKLLVDQKYTQPKKLAIQGGSNGGLLMGAAVTQHPEQYGAVVARVGIYDMLRTELTPNGQFNVTEYGSVKDPEQFKALYAYSPVHQVKDGTKYPSVLFTSGANDPRVDPFHSRKMVARMQAATSAPKPILLRANAETGHGAGTPLNARIEEEVDVYSFVFNELGMTYKPNATKKPTAPAPQ
ncbi:prolyl oligopeptidase family serine peptidase [Corallococcus sp. BB11-1]|uniref:prolyl oligopeptidase family serine peptidase n=1 Tax=Corallococcus sp. BB11-1 TaxID=2996783 RepID=UPI00226ED60D|nr:prolyl oligopeptidase family serine peptidase [Corallococcus sp. BB11-1]MCY1035404.1 prolyl oligopeptidase family serine peptidase [Corallococcus sp. BB11-1]